MATLARLSRISVAGISLLALTACGDALSNFDIDLRSSGGSAADTSDAVRGATDGRPTPDDRGVLSYPDYQVAVAERGDTVTSVAQRVGLPAAELARFNGLPVNAPLRDGEIVALPTRVAEPSAATGAISTQPIGSSGVDISTLAGGAIDRSEDGAVGVPGQQPIRHRVAPGETAFTIARRYNVSVEALAAWNGLGNDYAVRNDQFLLIPTASFATPQTTAAAAPAPSAPGQGSPTPTPPSAATALPTVTPSADPIPTPAQPDMADDQTDASVARFQMPVSGSIVRDFEAGEFEWIEISASAGTPVAAAAEGTVLLMTLDSNQNAILIVRHPDDLLSVYAGIDGITVARGDQVRRGQRLAVVKDGASSMLFQVRKGNQTLDPLTYLQ